MTMVNACLMLWIVYVCLLCVKLVYCN